MESVFVVVARGEAREPVQEVGKGSTKGRNRTVVLV